MVKHNAMIELVSGRGTPMTSDEDSTSMHILSPATDED